MNDKQFLRKLLSVFIVAGALMLSACSEEHGWVAVEHEGVPYGEDRTAGSGIKYVRAYMLDEKGPILDPIMEEVNTLLDKHENMSMPVQDEAIASAEPVFTKKLKK